LWEGKVIPRKEEKLFSRSYMRKAWRDRLRSLDRDVNAWATSPLAIRERATQYLLMERRIMVAKRKAYRFS
jgi:hypothetical protein